MLIKLFKKLFKKSKYNNPYSHLTDEELLEIVEKENKTWLIGAELSEDGCSFCKSLSWAERELVRRGLL